MSEVRVASLADAEQYIASLQTRVHELELELARQRKVLMVAWSPWWKRLWWQLNGWPGYRYTDAPAWRPWDNSRGW